jgi:DNA helicase-2/ATP-dependent DNA helicase PcrA
MVDEYQDTNMPQYRAVMLLAQAHHNICVVGDDDQSIYKFRGANIRNILDFEKVFPEAKVIRLEQNYRSTGYILKAANAVIAHNEGRKEKTLWTSRPDGEKPEFWAFETAQDEARAVVRDICDNRSRFPYRSCAVLYRTNSQSRVLEERFVQEGVPYRLIGGTNFYQRKEIKDVLAYLKVIASGSDEVAVRRIINVPRRGIGDTTVQRIAAIAAERDIRFLDAVRLGEEDPQLKRSAGKLRQFRELIEELRGKAKSMRVWQLIEEVILSSGYAEEIRREDDPDQAATRLENIRELENKAMDLEDAPGDEGALGRFLEEVALVADVDALPGDNERVVLMTLHSAKGLEFPKVYITGMEQGLFPGNKSLCSEDGSDLEEERRLCYVGFTRAQEKLILTGARVRMVNGETQFHDYSQFIEEIPPELLIRKGGAMRGAAEGRACQLEREDLGGFGRRTSPAGWKDFGESFSFGSFGKRPAAAPPKRPAAQLFPEESGEEPADPSELKPGDRVKSPRFGEGTVVRSEPERRDYKVTVDFDRAGRKVMLASFAGLVRCRETL